MNKQKTLGGQRAGHNALVNENECTPPKGKARKGKIVDGGRKKGIEKERKRAATASENSAATYPSNRKHYSCRKTGGYLRKGDAVPIRAKG